jgi:hypothetical protein
VLPPFGYSCNLDRDADAPCDKESSSRGVSFWSLIMPRPWPGHFCLCALKGCAHWSGGLLTFQYAREKRVTWALLIAGMLLPFAMVLFM